MANQRNARGSWGHCAGVNWLQRLHWCLAEVINGRLRWLQAVVRQSLVGVGGKLGRRRDAAVRVGVKLGVAGCDVTPLCERN